MSHDTQVKQEAPERIWISSDRGLKWTDYAFDGGIEYVRVSAPIVAPVVDQHDPVCCAKYMRGGSVPEGAHECGDIPWCRRCAWCVTDADADAPASTVAPQQSKHHKHCSSWTVNTSGERQPCDCVCECTHSMFQHIRPGEHYWYEDCAVDGCPCMKFTAPASPATLGDEADTDSCSHWREGDSDNCVLCGVDLGPTTEADVAATTPPSTLAKAAAEEIISAFPEIKEHDKWVTLGRVKIDIATETETFERATAPQLPVKDQIAAIIERCLAGGE